ncbi:EAL domain-containing protein [Flavobacterium sp. MXW15]|uniref:EAL domain-containing protein n=1 Tax=Xanthomonas chitinilytica TaxID=2989819 RepID=A0ABT3JW63_9XANT|nr:EAL domain-containing protein [Xanthomonas sp. H13-6]MCW4455129.1 EAL domain-containing protein [Flavobacterium sp. MXW15]MCW4472705.1 EAL domain-containing protein [Xanthomonas sp. H13-6]
MNRPDQRNDTSAGDHVTAHVDTLAELERALTQPHPAHLHRLLQAARDALREAMTDRRSAQLRYAALFDAVPDPVSILSETGTVLDLNKAGIRAYGRPREDIVGQPIENLNPDLPSDHLEPVWESLNRGQTYVIEVTNMRGDGSRFPVEVHSAGFEHEGRKCIVAVARDLSGRWQAESRYRLLMESIDKGVLLFDREFRVVSANPAAHRILGVGSDEPLQISLSADDWITVDEHGQRLPLERWPVAQAFASGRIIRSTTIGLYHRPRGRMIWISTTNVPVFSSDRDHPDHVFGLFSDITELKRNNALFDRAQSLAHIGGWEWDRSQQRLYLTEEAQRILGQEQPLERMPQLLDCLRGDDQQHLQQALLEAVERRAGFELELQGQRGDGHSFWVRMIGEVEAGDLASSRIAGTLQDITERKQAEETLRIQARTDPLTGIMNRDAVLGDLGQRLANPTHARVAVLYIDLDRFKTVNDVLGHNAGDELLVEAAHRIATAVGTEGLIARFGGDEFLVICDARDRPQRPEQLATAISAAFASPFRFGKDEFSVTTSIGIARAPQDGTRPQQLIQSADVAMYDCKRRTRNGWQVFSPELAQRQQDRLQIESRLRRALDENEFRLVYQPQVDLRHGRVVAAEALIRWQNIQLGELRPDLFIGHAESTGDIVRIGNWVLREACRQVREWLDQGLGIVRVAINVSYRQFSGDDLARNVRQALDEFALPGTALELEFTERVLIEDAPATLQTFAELRAMGVVLTIDDFGEGYSALNYLRRLPIHGLKLSQLFVEGVPGNRSDVAVCEAVCGIARSLGLGLVAEGVESEAQRQFLLELGVPVGQGFLFAPGLPPDEFARRIA